MCSEYCIQGNPHRDKRDTACVETRYVGYSSFYFLICLFEVLFCADLVSDKGREYCCSSFRFLISSASLAAAFTLLGHVDREGGGFNPPSR
jgi:hypothetical protein